MLPTDRDQELIKVILDDFSVMQRRLEEYNVTEDRFKNDMSPSGQDAYDLVMSPVYRMAEDALHLSDALMGRLSDYPWDDIRGFRNFVAHGYRNVDRDIAWSVVHDDLPELAALLRGVLVTGD